METPIADFVKRYNELHTVRLHMPGHKGKLFLGCEHLDITEVNGADALYEAEGIIAQSEANATDLFGSGRTLYSTEGSSQCIRAMLYLALTNRPKDALPVIVAARNVHKAFLYAAALLDFEIVWLWPEENTSLCSCAVTPEGLERTLKSLSAPPAAVYLTSPDYLGGTADVAALAEVCHRFGTILAVDNAHGAYLHFLQTSMHPLDLGADICCDSAHKTLPVLTGGAYLHISKNVPKALLENAKTAMAMFGSTSPSYLILQSLDLCNRYLADDYSDRLCQCVKRLDVVKDLLHQNGWSVQGSDPLRLTVAGNGRKLAETLRSGGVECEYADRDYLVLMVTPENDVSDLQRVVDLLGRNSEPVQEHRSLPLARGEQVMTVREALFAPHESISAVKSLGCICGAPTVACPPAIPIAVSGERIGLEALELFAYYGVESVDIIKK